MFLLDTHIWLWWVNQNFEKIPQSYISILEKKVPLFVSSISCVEATILFKKNRIELTGPFDN